MLYAVFVVVVVAGVDSRVCALREWSSISVPKKKKEKRKKNAQLCGRDTVHTLPFWFPR